MSLNAFSFFSSSSSFPSSFWKSYSYSSRATTLEKTSSMRIKRTKMVMTMQMAMAVLLLLNA